MKKQGFWHLVAENDLYEMVEKSGYGEQEFVHFQKRRLRNSLISMLGAVLPAIILSPWLSFLALLFFVITWRREYTKERLEFQDVLYEKQLSWFVFQRLIVTYLKGVDDSISGAFEKILDRLEEGEFKDSLHRLSIEITRHPDKVLPYLQFAKDAAGGTDESLTFMTALYNFKNNSHDSAIIDGLSERARNDMRRGIRDIRKMKEKSFYLFPTKLTMLNVIPMFGYMAGVAVDVFTNNMNI
ncbi:hypothetical protein ACDX77_19185 [Bacillus velezensis]|uniref:hypothetical protein n=1 Tax=Bacillus velezensis TaxID=492670 RepID=UPI00355834B0